jgi:hypothetical protein
MIEIRGKTRRLEFSKDEQFLASGATTRKALVEQFNRALSMKPLAESDIFLNVSESALKLMIRKYSEQLVYQPLREIQFWFSYKSGAFIEPGYPPLYYSRTKGKAVSPNKTAIAAIGEGVSGLVAQRLYSARKLARPNHDFPDVVMKSGSIIYLVEAKASLSSSGEAARGAVFDELPRMVSYTSACSLMDEREIQALLVATDIINEGEFEIYVLEIRLQ